MFDGKTQLAAVEPANVPGDPKIGGIKGPAPAGEMSTLVTKRLRGKRTKAMRIFFELRFKLLKTRLFTNLTIS